LHGLFALLHLTINFSILPVIYVIAADDKIKQAIGRRQFGDAAKLLLSFNDYDA
jgi:hypothetical protein